MDINRIIYLRNLGIEERDKYYSEPSENDFCEDRTIKKVKLQNDETYSIILNNYKSKNWEELLTSFESFQYFPVFLDIYQELDDKSYFTLLGDILSGSTYYHDYSDVIRYLLNHSQRDVKYRKYLMNSDERKFLKSLKANTIYRGCSNQHVDGYSWTLNYEKADFFAKRIYGEALILKGSFIKSNAIAYFDREDEIFINPKHVSDIRIVERIDNHPNQKDDDEHDRRNKNQEIRDIVKKTEPYEKLLREIQNASQVGS